jgi:hypothetical protein
MDDPGLDMYSYTQGNGEGVTARALRQRPRRVEETVAHLQDSAGHSAVLFYIGEEPIQHRKAKLGPIRDRLKVGI